MEKITSDPTTHEAIISTCDKLKSAMLARYEASNKETSIKLEVIKTQNELLLVKEELNSLRFN